VLASFALTNVCIKVYRFVPTAAVKWQPLVKGLYFTSCLTQCLFLSDEGILTAGTDGHAVVWPLSSDTARQPTGSTASASTLKWQEPIRIHQSASKAMASCCLDVATKLVVSGGDDGSLAILLIRRALAHPSSESIYTTSPLLLSRTHASAVTSCAILTHNNRIFILSSGNDQWIRLWEVYIREGDGKSALDVGRMERIKTNVADVSSMAVLDAQESGLHARVLICGVGMEVVRLEWDKEARTMVSETAMSCT
jgi:WD40 repeat protein